MSVVLSLAQVLGPAVLSGVLAAPPTTSDTVAASPHASTSKKQAYLEHKAALRANPPKRAPRPTRVGRRAHEPVFARNLRTDEVAILQGPGRLDETGRHDFFRCWFTQKPSAIPAELAAVLVAAAEHFDTHEVRIISGFRHPKYNLLLRKKGREVAKRSRHTRSQAIDFFLPGVGTQALYEWLMETHDGGVGRYLVSEFVHVDLGPKRTWDGT